MISCVVARFNKLFNTLFQFTMSSSVLQSSIRPLRIGMIGAGTVGGGVYEIIMNRLGGSSNKPPAGNKNNTPIITKICVRDPAKARDLNCYSITYETGAACVNRESTWQQPKL